MLSRKTKYGIKALTYICRHEGNGNIPISIISESENIPHKFLESILLTLRKGGILGSQKGKNGGYYFIKTPDKILMTDIIRMLNGPIAMFPCVSLNYYEKCADCPDEETCGVNRLMLEVRNATLNIFRNKTLLQLTQETEKGGNS